MSSGVLLSCTILVLALALTSEVAFAHIDPVGNWYVIKWRFQYNDDLFQVSHDPSGIRDYWRVFLCRGRSPSTGNWIAGYLWVAGDKKLVCRMPNTGSVIEATRYQVLEAPPGTLSWIKCPTDGSTPNGAIGSGISDTNREQFVCRALDEDFNLIPGKFAPYNRRCYIAVDGREVGKRAGECLVENLFGVTNGVSNETPEAAEAQNTEPPSTEKTTTTTMASGGRQDTLTTPSTPRQRRSIRQLFQN